MPSHTQSIQQILCPTMGSLTAVVSTVPGRHKTLRGWQTRRMICAWVVFIGQTSYRPELKYRHNAIQILAMPVIYFMTARNSVSQILWHGESHGNVTDTIRLGFTACSWKQRPGPHSLHNWCGSSMWGFAMHGWCCRRRNRGLCNTGANITVYLQTISKRGEEKEECWLIFKIGLPGLCPNRPQIPHCCKNSARRIKTVSFHHPLLKRLPINASRIWMPPPPPSFFFLWYVWV